MKYVKLTLLAFFFLITSCEKLIFNDDPANTPTNNFEIFWTDFDRYYPFFQTMNINWDSVHSYYMPLISDKTTDIELLNIFTQMIKPFRESHVSIVTPSGWKQFKDDSIWFNSSSYLSGRPFNPSKYLLSFKVNDLNIQFYDVINHNIGYISINSFSSSQSFFIIDDIIKQFKDKDGIIIDIRENTGGEIQNSITISSRFADKNRIYGKIRTKNGPGKNNFSQWYDLFVEPQGASQFSKPVVILTSRRTASAAEFLTLEMKALPQVISVGDTTNGCVSEPTWRELPNGWSFRLPFCMVATPDFKVYSGKGIPPDFPVIETQVDITHSIDKILEKGIEIIEEKNQ
jgi:hypothetical protein